MDLSTYDTCSGCGGRKRKCARACRSCRYKVGNTGLGQFSDSIKKLEGAIEYLKRHQLRPRQ